ncbi:soluble lytic murein transglycosylase [Syntrophus gentianae]|uniref:Soluble lytic murein transglycosylase n=1 Tax=Syntrophus gentianae TaxID=43775 RepID=A0A1H7WQU8_9BACT|nr:soluble lytic murein transglycosylase [Syntrophus gentianae]
MRKYRKRYFSVLSCLVVIFLVFSIVPGSEAGAGKAEEAVIQKVVQHLKDKKADLGDRDLWIAADAIWRESQDRNVDYRLILALIEVESNYQHDVVSPDGSRGFMQLKPSTARVIAKKTDLSGNGPLNLFDPRVNIKIGVYFLSQLMTEFKTVRKALYAYNVGPHRAKRNIAKLPLHKDPQSPFTRRVMLAFQNNLSTLPAF